MANWNWTDDQENTDLPEEKAAPLEQTDITQPETTETEAIRSKEALEDAAAKAASEATETAETVSEVAGAMSEKAPEAEAVPETDAQQAPDPDAPAKEDGNLQQTLKAKLMRGKKKKKLSIEFPQPTISEKTVAELSAPEDDNLDSVMQEEEGAPVLLPMDENEILQKKEPEESGEPEEMKKHHRRRWYGLPVGALVLCLAAVGLFFIGQQTVRYIHNVVTDDSEERAYDTFIATVVMMDPDPFESISAADNQQILQTAIWQTVFTNISGSQNYDEYARLIVPADQVASTAVSLFGVNCILTPADIPLSNVGVGIADGSPEATIAYDAENDTYHVPLVATVGSYQPYTVSVSSRNNVDTLRVAYCISVNDSTQIAEGAEILGDNLVVTKYMEYEISYDADMDMKYISAIRSAES